MWGNPVQGAAPLNLTSGLPLPRLPSCSAYLLGLMPPELIDLLGLRIPHLRRDPHYFLPTLSGKYLLFGSDAEATRSQFHHFFSAADWEADQRLQAEVGALRDDLAPAWLEVRLGGAVQSGRLTATGAVSDSWRLGQQLRWHAASAKRLHRQLLC